MSAAPIDREVSIASSTVASSRLTLTVACGRATPTISAARATSRIATGHVAPAAGRPVDEVRQQAGRGPALGVVLPPALAQRDEPDEHRDRPAARAASQGTRSSACPPQEGDERAQPVAGGGEDDVAGADRGELAGDVAPLGLGGGAKRSRSFLLRVSTRSWRPVSGSTSQSSPAFGRFCSRGSRISTATTSWRPASWSSGARQSRGPRKSETTTARERWRASEAAWRSAAPSEVDPRRPGASSGSSRSAASSPTRPTRPWRTGSTVGSGPPKVSVPRRFPRRVERWPTAIATPSATSAFRRSAVPKRIDGEVSSTSQVTSTRSAWWTRTCGSPVRAVTFQSIRRTSSPGTYGRMSASSVPSPRSDER